MAQKAELKMAPAGRRGVWLGFQAEKKLKLEDIIHMREVANAKAGEVDDKDRISPMESATSDLGRLRNPGARQVLENMSLATTPDGTPARFPGNSDRETNKVTPPIQEKFDDLAGKLLDEADKLTDKYDTYNLSLAAINADAGHVGKGSGDLNSTSATAATGNQKQPPANYGGVSREGRQGARAHGAVMGDEGVNRRGMDTPQEGQERARSGRSHPPGAQRRRAEGHRDRHRRQEGGRGAHQLQHGRRRQVDRRHGQADG